MSGYFITFEGIDGCGKSTQVRRITERLRARGVAALATSQPGGTPLGRVLRASILYTESLTAGGEDIDLTADGTHQINNRTEALLYAADRAHHVYNVIRPALAQDQVVLCDRYIDSSVAYQGTGRGLPEEEVRKLSEWATDFLSPDLTILLDLPATAGYDRITRTFDRLETDGRVFMESSRQTYLQLAKSSPQSHVIVDALGDIDEVTERIWSVIIERLRVAGVVKD